LFSARANLRCWPTFARNAVWHGHGPGDAGPSMAFNKNKALESALKFLNQGKVAQAIGE
jgi:hypothetical protein